MVGGQGGDDLVPQRVPGGLGQLDRAGRRQGRDDLGDDAVVGRIGQRDLAGHGRDDLGDQRRAGRGRQVHVAEHPADVAAELVARLVGQADAVALQPSLQPLHQLVDVVVVDRARRSVDPDIHVSPPWEPSTNPPRTPGQQPWGGAGSLWTGLVTSQGLKAGKTCVSVASKRHLMSPLCNTHSLNSSDNSSEVLKNRPSA